MLKHVSAWTKRIWDKTKAAEGRDALRLYMKMREEGVLPNHYTFVAVLKASSAIADLKAGKMIHSHVIASGQINIFVSTTLVDMYAKCGSIEDARLVFQNMTHRNVVSWNAIITGYAQADMGSSALELYTRMQNEGFPPDARTFVAALKACACLAAHLEDSGTDSQLLKTSYLQQGRAIHARIQKQGLESNIFIASTLVHMYAKCGSIEDARHVFENMTQPNMVSWNAMIIGYTQMEMGSSALDLSARVHDNSFAPNARTFVAALKACVSLAEHEAGKVPAGQLLKTSYFQQARAIHAEVRKRGLESDMFIACTLVDMYAKCGSIKDARKVFEKMRHRDVVSWNAMITAYAQLEMGASALELYRRMRNEGFTPDPRTFVAILKACGSLATLKEDKGASNDTLNTNYFEEGRAIHAEIVKQGLDSDVFIANTLIDMYAKCRSIKDARQVFETMKHQSVVSWTAIITGYAQLEMGDMALQLYARMQAEGFTPNDRTFVAVLQACASLAAQQEGKGTEGKLLKAGYLEQGRAIHAQVLKGGFESDIFIASSLVDMYAKCESITDARKVFERMSYRDVVSWNAMLAAYAQIKMEHITLELYARMRNEGLAPDARTFVAALNACASLAAQEGKGADGECLRTSYLEQGRAIHAEVTERGFELDIFIANTLVDMYAKFGSMEDAFHVFEKMRHRNLVSWNAMITGCAQIEMGDCALELFAYMQHEGFIPNVLTFVAALHACGSLASLKAGKELHCQINRLGLQSELFIANGIINMYGRCGSMWDAQQCFDSLLMRDSVTWNALIAGYSGQGDSELVFYLYKKMQQEGIKPDNITFISVLNVCSHNGLVEKGQMLFQAMHLKYETFPSCNHYTCMTDLLARAGQLDGAVAIAMKMPFEPNTVTWMTILGACQKWSNEDIGRNTFECSLVSDETFVQHMCW